MRRADGHLGHLRVQLSCMGTRVVGRSGDWGSEAGMMGTERFGILVLGIEVR